MERRITHLNIPDFYATLEELRRPELKKRPLALAEPRPRAVLQAVNALARSEGLRAGMPLAAARRSCRLLQIVPPDYRFYGEQHQEILSALNFFSPLVEGTTLGHYFVDITGTRRLWGPATDTAYRMEKELAERRSLLAGAGLAHNKLVSQVAARIIRPGDLNFVFPGAEASFMAPLPVRTLPGIGSKTSSLLYEFNIQRMGELADLPENSLFGVFGRQGRRLIELARGFDPTPVVPSRKASGISSRRMLDHDEIDRDRLEATLLTLVEEAAWNLRRLNRQALTVSLELRYADGVTARNRKAFPTSVSNDDRGLFRVARAIFRQLFTRRVAVRRITLELEKLVMPSRQIPLFAEDGRDERLQSALDQIRTRFGNTAVAWGPTVPAEPEKPADRATLAA